MKIHFCSDLHLEINGKIDKAFNQMTGGDVLILNGDITCARYFQPRRNDAESRSAQKILKYLAENIFTKYNVIYYVMGNHEHYGHFLNDFNIGDKTYFGSVSIFRKYFAENNIPIQILNNETVLLDDKTYLFGGTLWTDFRRENPQDMIFVQRGMNDYRIIYKNITVDNYYGIRKLPIIPEDTLAEHRKSLQHLEYAYNNTLAHDKNLIVVTHHAPSFQSEANRGSTITAGYASDLDEFILNRPKITHWIHGHTHNNVNYNIGNTEILTAMYGYHGYEPHMTKNFKIGEINI